MDIKKIESRIWDYFNFPKIVEEFIIQSSKAIGSFFPKVTVKFKLELMHGDQLLKKIGKLKGVVQVDKYLKIEYANTIHSLLAFKLQDGFTMVKHSGSTTINALFHRYNPLKNNLYEFFLPHPDSNLQIMIDGVSHTLGGKHQYGGMWLSPNIDFDLHMPKNTNIEVISIVIDGAVLESFVDSGKVDFIKELIKNRKEFFFLEECGIQINDNLRRIFEHSKFDLAGMMEIEGLTKLTVARFLQKITARELNETSTNLNTTSMARVLRAKQMIHANLGVRPKLSVLSRELGTNRVTLQKEFKTVFNKSIYQYYLDTRLEEAKRLLETGNYTVSEVSTTLGYMSLGQFSLSFQKKHGSNPSTYKTPK